MDTGMRFREARSQEHGRMCTTCLRRQPMNGACVQIVDMGNTAPGPTLQFLQPWA
jgi:hypothetical protein